MNVPNFDAAMDLSGLAAAATGPTGPTGASYVVGADERTFDSVLAKSKQHPIIIEFTSPRAGAQQLSDDLAALANEAAGKFLLVRINVDASPAIAQALGIQGLPMVAAALAGQLVTLFQGTMDKAEAAVHIDEVLKAAVANGIVGRAQPVTGNTEAAESGPDPRFAAADAAMEAGDYALAVAEFDTILASAPKDPDAIAGKAGAELLVRLGEQNPDAVIAEAAAHPENVDAQLDAADLELAGGVPEAAFARLVEVVRNTGGEDREKARVRLLALFETVGASDPAVLKARRDLMSALF